MKITKLHLILLAIIAVVIGLYVYQIQQEQKRITEMAERVAAAREAEKRQAEEEKKKAEQVPPAAPQEPAKAQEQKQYLAVQAIAVAGEYWQLAKKEGKSVAKGQETLHQAKEKLQQQDFDTAWELARRAIEEFKSAPARKRYYTVRRGDSLWKIAKMPRHYGRGALWTVIWRANQKKIPDFDLIQPRQVLLIPKLKTHKHIPRR